jgi:hypothetical protein
MPSKTSNSQNTPPTVQSKQQLSNQFVAQNHRPKKDNPSTKPSSYELKQTCHTPDSPLVPVQQKKLYRRSSKPIITWFQRKLAGTVRARRVSEGDNLRVPNQRHSVRRPSIKDRPQRKHSVSPTAVSKPSSPPTSTKRDDTHTSNAISLNEDDGYSSAPEESRNHYDQDEDGSSLARDSTWSPASVLEADDNASLRPIPPSAPPSPSPSRSSSSYLSDPRTFRSMTASTKPTTLLSVDLTGGVAHIAQVPPAPVSAGPWFSPHARTSSTTTSIGLSGSGSITFSALPSSFESSPRSSHALNPSLSLNTGHLRPVQAPQHTAHHPRNNPRPSSPPSDNASVLTLASSAFAFPGTRIGVNALTYPGDRSVMAGDSISHISASQFMLGEDDRMYNDGDIERDIDASVRALRPRSSRRGSWESETSDWSAGVGGGAYSMTSPGTPIGTKERSLRTTNSIRTGCEASEGTSVEAEVKDTEDLSTAASEQIKQEEVEISGEITSQDDTHHNGPINATENHFTSSENTKEDPASPSDVEKTPQLHSGKENDVRAEPDTEDVKAANDSVFNGHPLLSSELPVDLSENND